MFQSLLSQGISLLAGPAGPAGGAGTAFQSLLSQGISLLKHRVLTVEYQFSECFNPFLVRASVYCVEETVQEIPFPRAFQSLLSQGISLLVACNLADNSG